MTVDGHGIPLPRSAAAWATCRPLRNVTVPANRRAPPVTTPSSVDLPVPFEPLSPITSPAATANDTGPTTGRA